MMESENLFAFVVIYLISDFLFIFSSEVYSGLTGCLLDSGRIDTAEISLWQFNFLEYFLLLKIVLVFNNFKILF